MASCDILVLGYTPTLSHLSRPLALSIELRKRGFNLIFAGQSAKIRFIVFEGFEVIPIFEPEADILYGNIRKGKLRFVEKAVIETMIAADLEVIGTLKPSMVLSDGRFSAMISAQIAGIPHAAIVNASSTPYRTIPYVPVLTKMEWVNRLVGKSGHAFLEKMNLMLEMRVFDNAMRVFKNLSRRYGLSSAVTATNCLCGTDLTLMADIPEYFPTTNLPENYYYIGQLTWTPTQPIAPVKWWPPDTQGRCLIYFSMGTTGVPEFFKVVANAFSKSKVCAVVSTGGQPADIHTKPPHLYVAEYIDGDRIMEICELVVCHGGNGTIYQALKHGKPVIGIPTLPDQKFNMRRVEALGLGKSMALKRFVRQPDTLTDLINAVLDSPGIARNVAGFRDKIASWDSVKLGADHIEALLQH